MAEDLSRNDTNTGPSDGQPPLTVNAQYIKDLSFEAPKAPLIFSAMKQDEPDVNINVSVNSAELKDEVYIEHNIYEVVLGIEATCTVAGETAFLLELEYAGLFTLNVDSESRNPVLLIECPRLLFPFARNILADISREGGFPPLMLGPMDFAGMYHQQISAINSEGAPDPI